MMTVAEMSALNAHRSASLSCPAKAGHPVLTALRFNINAGITGSSAFADDDNNER
jgi:hypothetical protein